ncbi:MAG: serine/threonine-protein kinase [Tahibacter sp.]
MDIERQRRAFSILKELLDMPEAEHAAAIARVCADDADLATEVRIMLAAHRHSGILDQPALDVAARLSGTEEIAPELAAGTCIGAWRVLEFLGNGGMGSVFLVEREGDRYTQRGALKMIRRGMDTADVIDRFRSERRILARLQHAQIARLLDGGLSAGGQPYFVMEYVDGITLGAWLERVQPDVAARTALFIKLAEAVAYAHSQLVVHRDLKPGNVLVGADGEPHLLDFGVAKVLEADDDAQHTATAARFLSRAYAAPEQLRGEAPGTAADVYALGALLFELLTGTRLHDAPQRYGHASDRLSRCAAASASPLGVPARQLRGDLGVIVTRATDPEPERRYATAQALADDLRRYRDGAAILARGDNAVYRFTRFIQRHVVASAAAAIAILALLIGGSLALWQAGRAQEAAARAQAAQRFLASVFDAASPDAASGSKLTARELLDRGAARIDQELGSEPALRAEMQRTLGVLYRQLGQFDEASRLLQSALASANSVGAQKEIVQISIEQVRVFRQQGRYAQALAVLDEFLATPKLPSEHSDALSEKATIEDAQGNFKQGLADAREAAALDAARGSDGAADRARDRHIEALLLGRLADYAEADTAFADAIAQASAVFGAEHTRVAAVRHDYATILSAQQRSADAEVQLRAALDIRRKRLTNRHALVGETLQSLGAALRQQGKLDACEAALNEALDIQREALGAHHPDVANTLNSLGMLAMSRKRFDVAVGYLGDALAIFREIHLDESPQAVTVASNLGVLLTRLDRYDEAEPLLQGALRQHRSQVGNQHPWVMSDLNGLSQLARRRGHYGPAETFAAEAVTIADQTLGNSRDAAGVRLTLAAAQLRNAHAAAALDNFQKVSRLMIELKAQDDPRFPVASAGIVKAQLELGQIDAARPLAEQALADRQAHFSNDPGGLALAHSLLSRIARQQGRHDAARESSRLAANFLAQWKNPDSEAVAEIRSNAQLQPDSPSG